MDGGAQVSYMSREYCEDHGYEIKPIDHLVHIEGSGGAGVPYIGYVEANLKIPGVGKFDKDVLFLISPHTTKYQRKVPFQVGTKILDDIVYSISDSELKNMSETWKQTYVSTVLSGAAVVDGSADPSDSFNLDDIKGKVVSTIKTTIGPFQTAVIKGKSKITSHDKRVHVIVEALDYATNFFVPGNTAELKPGSSRIDVVVRNMSGREITINSKTSLGTVTAANKIPPLLAPKQVENEDELDDEIKAQNLSAQAEEAEQIDREATVRNFDFSAILSDPEGDDETIAEAHQIIRDTAEAFSQHDLDLGKTSLVKHHIKLTDSVPFKERYRRIPPGLYKEVKEHIQEMLKVGAIRPSNSPWASAVVLVRKKDGKLRFCIDLRKLNNRTVKDAYSLPRIDETLDTLNGAVWFTSLDLKSGYWQVEMDEESKGLTAFTVGPLGFYECDRMPFGLTNAPATFQRLMQSCLGNLHLQYCIIYLDDIIIFSRTLKDHLKRLRSVLEKIKEAGLKLKPSKCEFFKKEIGFLGHLVSEKGYKDRS